MLSSSPAPITRRRFFQASAVGGAACACTIWVPRRGVPDAPDSLERFLIETPREPCLEQLAARLQDDSERRRVGAALLEVAMRSVDFHHVGFVVQAGLRAAPLAPRPELPLLWCVNYFKDWQRRMGHPGLDPLRELDVELDVAAADEQLDRGLCDMDGAATAEALVALHRTAGPAAAWERVWRVSSRDWTFVGHRAIAPALLHRAAIALDSQRIEPILRWLGPFQFYWYATGGRGQSWDANRALAKEHADRTALGWTQPSDDPGPTLDLLSGIRAGDVDAACARALSGLTSGKLPAQSIWDAVFLGTAELLLRTTDSHELGQFPVHAVTSAEALHYASITSDVHSTRLLATLQGVAWVTEFTRAASDDSTLSDARIDALEAVDVGSDAAGSLETILDGLRPRANAPTKGPRAVRADQIEAAPALLSWMRRFGDSALARRAVIAGVLRSAGPNAHHLKLPVALFDMSAHTSPQWRARIEASLVHVMPSPHGPETDFFERVGGQAAR